MFLSAFKLLRISVRTKWDGHGEPPCWLRLRHPDFVNTRFLVFVELRDNSESAGGWTSSDMQITSTTVIR